MATGQDSRKCESAKSKLKLCDPGLRVAMSFLSGFPPEFRFLQNPPTRQHRSSRPPHKGAAFRTRLPNRCATAGGKVATANLSLSLLGPDNPFFNGERHQRQIDSQFQKIRLTISPRLAEASGDSRPQAALRSRHHGASSSRGRYRPTAPTGIGEGARIFRTPRAISP